MIQQISRCRRLRPLKRAPKRQHYAQGRRLLEPSRIDHTRFTLQAFLQCATVDLMWSTASAPTSNVRQDGCRKSHEGEPSTKKASTIGLDVTKHVFQNHCVNAVGVVALRRKQRHDYVAGAF